MARALRIEYAGAVYHVMARGNQGQAIFRDDQDRRRFLEVLGEACEKTGWRLHAYVLMGNHYHLLLETPEANLVTGKQRESHAGGARRAHGEAGARRLLSVGLKALGLSAEELAALSKGAPEKTALAWWLRERTTVSLRWVSQELAMGHYTRVSQAVSRLQRKPGMKLERLKRRLLEAEAENE